MQSPQPAGGGGDSGGIEAELGEQPLGPGLVGEEACRQPEHGHGHRRVEVPRRSSMVIPMPPSRTPSSHVTTTPWRAASASMSSSSGAQQRTSQTVVEIPSAVSTSAAFSAVSTSRPMASMHTAAAGSPSAARVRRARTPTPTSCSPTLRAWPSRVADGDRAAVGEVHRVAQHQLQLLGAGRREQPHARHPGEQRHVVHAVVARSVGTGDAGAVDAEHDRQAVQRDVVDDLVPRPVEERRVDRDDRAHATHRHAGRRRDGVLLGDADVEEAVREAVLERQQPGRPGHRRGDRDDAIVGLGLLDDRLGERLRVARRARPWAARSADRTPGRRGGASRRRPRPAGSRGPSGSARGRRSAPPSTARRRCARPARAPGCRARRPDRRSARRGPRRTPAAAAPRAPPP